MDLVSELLKIALPAIIVCYGIYLIVRTFVLKELEKARTEASAANTKTVLPIRLQAYERICLLLERISLNNIIPRVNNTEMSPQELQSVVIHEIREEYNHNLSQQLYMSEGAWERVKLAVEANISLLNNTVEQLPEGAANLDLVRMIFENLQTTEQSYTGNALAFLKEEVKTLF